MSQGLFYSWCQIHLWGVSVRRCCEKCKYAQVNGRRRLCFYCRKPAMDEKRRIQAKVARGVCTVHKCVFKAMPGHKRCLKH
jgi:hypothetical protein